MSEQPTGGGELTQFEQLSAITPKKMPLAIIIGALAIGPILVLINMLAPTEAVDEMAEDAKDGDKPAATAPMDGDEEDI